MYYQLTWISEILKKVLQGEENDSRWKYGCTHKIQLGALETVTWLKKRKKESSLPKWLIQVLWCYGQYFVYCYNPHILKSVLHIVDLQ